ncbi:MAG: S10 family peptidase [Kordiimonas sp.]
MKYILLIITLSILSIGGFLAESEAVSFENEVQADKLQYRAIAEELSLPAMHGLPPANYFSFSYLKASQPKQRPVTFAFNGGPGSASHWLHLGGVGPKRIPVSLKGQQPFSVITNKENILESTDLVFIDPIGTGFSRASNPVGSEGNVPTGASQEFWGVVEDAKSITAFIKAWLQKHRRANSPIYILGESYGSLRATLVADELERKHSISVDGLILLSAVQNYRNIRTPDGSIMGYVSLLPSYAATAWFHKKAGQDHPSLEAFLAKAREFAGGSYAHGLISGNRLSESKRKDIAESISSYTGLDASYILDNNLHVGTLDFLRNLQHAPLQKLSRLDSRHSGSYEGEKSNGYGLDPYASIVREPFIRATQSYLTNDLKVPTSKGAYIASARNQPYWRWNWNVWGDNNIPSGARFINVMPNLERTLKTNTKMKVMVVAGYFDFATPFYSIENAFSELTSGQKRVSFHHYKAGHIIYLDDAARRQLSNDIRAFIEDK